MGITISDVSQSIFSSKPKPAELGAQHDVVLFRDGTGRRHTHFSSAFDDSTGHTVKWRNEVAGPWQVQAKGSDRRVASWDVDMRELASRVARPRGGPLRVFIDVSCLPRNAIALAFAAIRDIALQKPVDLTIGYSLASYSPSPAVWARLNRTIRPVHPAFSGWSADGPNLPLDVVVGLGYEKGKALGAVEYLEPRYRWVFVPESPESDYLNEVEKHNREVINANKDRISHYQVLSPVDTYFTLRSLVDGIAREARPVLLPFGPKIFFAINLLVALSIDEAAVWHVDGESDEYSERKPSRHSVALTCRLTRAAES
jgi:hypothetical protein